MCGLTGIILGKKERTQVELAFIKALFTSMFSLSEDRGPHASGIITLSKTGKTSLYKLPLSPSRLISLGGYGRVLGTVTNETTAILGHSRWKTVGTEFNNNNNQPLVIGKVVGTHNGTITNASDLFMQYSLKRLAQVDSEILFRMANDSLEEGKLSVFKYKNYLEQCDGNLSFVLASKKDPEHVFIFKGDKPLSLYYNNEMQIILYASLERYIKDSLISLDGWSEVKLKDNNFIKTSYDNLQEIMVGSFSYNKKERRKKTGKYTKIKEHLSFAF